MKTLFIETRKKFKEDDLNFKLLDKLNGGTIGLTATVQYLNLIPIVKSYLESRGKKVIVKMGAYYDGHVLGCNSSAFDKSADTFLMITDGTFHAINNAVQLQREIYVWTTTTLEKIKQSDIDCYNKKLLTKKKKFLGAENIGILVSSKYGQHFNGANLIKGKIEKQNKRAYIFETDNINSDEFENFPQIQMWVNTACFGLARDDMRIINLADILEFI